MIRKVNRVLRKHPKKSRQRGTKTAYPAVITGRLRPRRWEKRNDV